MKLFIFIATVLSFSSFACTDFSGAFVSSAGEKITITQKGCESIKFEDKIDYDLELVFGAEYKYAQTVHDGGSELIILAKGNIFSDKLKIDVLVTSAGISQEIGIGEFSLDGSNNLHIVSSTFDMGGKLVDKVEETYTRVSK